MNKKIAMAFLGVVALLVVGFTLKTVSAEEGTKAKEEKSASAQPQGNETQQEDKKAEEKKSTEKVRELTDYAKFQEAIERGNLELVNTWVKNRCKYYQEVKNIPCDETMEQAQGRDCMAGKGEACYLLGQKYQGSEYGFVWLRFACLKRDSAVACQEAAINVTNRKPNEDGDKEAMPLLSYGCKLGNKGACDFGGFVFNRNKKYPEAEEMWGKVCNPNENPMACAGIADIAFLAGRLWDAMRYYELACAPITNRQTYCRKAEIIFEQLAAEQAKKVRTK